MLLLWADRTPRIRWARGRGARLLPDGQLRTLRSAGFLIAYDDPVGLARELAAFCGWVSSRTSPPGPRETPRPGGGGGREHFRGDQMPDEKQLWGGETAKAVENFPISGERCPRP